jgi:TonB family protein
MTFGFFLTALFLLRGPSGIAPVGQLELIALQAARIPSEDLAEMIRTRGVAFEPDADYLRALEMAGADETEMEALKAAHRTSSTDTNPDEARREANAIMHLIRGINLNRNDFHLEDAEPEFRAARDADPQSPFTHVALGELLVGMGGWDSADKEFKAALELDPTMAVAHSGLGDVLISKGNYDASAKEYREAVELDPHDAEFVHQLGLALQMAGDKKHGQEEMRIAQSMGWTPRAATRIRVGGQVMTKKRLHTDTPIYPVEAKSRGIEGVVKLNVLIGTDGAVRDLKVISGDPILAQAAAEAVRRWTYQPVTLVGKPIEIITEVDVNFHLH